MRNKGGIIKGRMVEGRRGEEDGRRAKDFGRGRRDIVQGNNRKRE